MKSIRWVFFLLAAGALNHHQAEAAPGYGQVSVAGVSIRGLSKAQAEQRLRRELRPRLAQRVGITDGQTTAVTTRAALGAQLNITGMLKGADQGAAYVPLNLNYPLPVVKAALARMAPRFERRPVNARPFEYHNKVYIGPEKKGRTLNLGAAMWRAKVQLESKPGELSVEVPVRLQEPAIKRSDLQGIDGVLATFKTSFRPSQEKRTKNMKLAVAAIDGTVLKPGEVYSQNKTVGPRTQARGYRTAIIFKNGYKAPGIGGGVSQVTGTLFNAALLGGLKIVSYRTHSQPVSYLPLGRDATVAWGSFDMKFANNTVAPVFIAYRMHAARLTVVLFGKKTDQRVRVKVTSQRLDIRHIKAQLYRTTTRPGHKAVTELVGKSEYQWKESEWYD